MTSYNTETLSPSEKALIMAIAKLMAEHPDKDGYTVNEILNTPIGYQWKGDVEVMNAASWLKTKGIVDIREKIVKNIVLGKEGWDYVKNGLPEKVLIKAIKSGYNDMKTLMESGIMDKNTVRIALSNLKPLGVNIKGGKILVDNLTEIEEIIGYREHILRTIAEQKEVAIDNIDPEVLENLKGRKDVIKIKERVLRHIIPVANIDILVSELGDIEPDIGQLTPEMIQSGKWREVKIRKYDITAFAPRTYMARTHPLTDIIGKIREIFVSMGFQEIKGPFVHSAFWNMDALFIPQDHPARDMQDTLYTKNPEIIEIDESIATVISAVHENGHNTGSRGWGYKWSIEKAKKALLRTHTTVETIRHLASHKEPPIKVFSIDRVFRNEAIDATHLPEFYQIEGIVMEENASFAMLLGILREFYTRMGFKNLRFRPAYFPYTEPSLEVEVNFHGRWLELGGAGIFRPEVTAPFGIKYPVLAWGLGLERLAMMLYGLDDIRVLYMSDLDWLRTRKVVNTG